jgi:secondary thiamine-phosphate synthase enzyme
MGTAWAQKSFSLKPRKRGCYLVTDEILGGIKEELKDYQMGLCHIFLKHTSAGLALCENFDPTVQKDMEVTFNRLVPEGKGLYQHDMEGPDDMPAHAKSVISGVSLSIPITNGHLALGTWQGIWLMEYRTHQQTREVTVTIQGLKK